MQFALCHRPPRLSAARAAAAKSVLEQPRPDGSSASKDRRRNREAGQASDCLAGCRFPSHPLICRARSTRTKSLPWRSAALWKIWRNVKHCRLTGKSGARMIRAGVRTRTKIGCPSRWRGRAAEASAFTADQGACLGGRAPNPTTMAGGGAPCPERKLKSPPTCLLAGSDPPAARAAAWRGCQKPSPKRTP